MSLRLTSIRSHRAHVDTPLAIVNIVLLLIFYFLLAGQDPRVSSALNLATTSALAPDGLPSPLLEVSGPEDWRLDGTAIRPEMLPGALAESSGPLHLLLDRDAPAGLLVGLLRRPELAGHEIRLVTMRGGGG
ncbi:biopolymer transport protein ExbD [Paracoccus halophilus]|uniref:Biopolymer transport protein ExbD n=1 Tax=Paracoccus halophilus TaxID=376733 RepID=A0A1I0TKB2_9RHOB|nr:biopolymer transporter ExbD [Paracoccus halophilus]SFA51993.1 biopolymer transport protein ExbD [Paracoccus halophilus]